MLARYIQANDVRLVGHEQLVRKQQASLQNLEHQVAQIANTLAKHPQGSLLSNTEVNPQESLKAAALRSGKDLVSHIIQNTIKVSVANQEIEITNKPFDLDAGENEKGKSKENLS